MIYGTTKKNRTLADVSNIQSINGKTGTGRNKELSLTSKDIPYKNTNVEEALDNLSKTVMPDYKLIENINRFENAVSWIADRNGFVLVKVKGLGSFELFIDDVPVKVKTLNNLDPDTEECFAQIFLIEKDSEVRINAHQSMACSCQFIPFKVIEITK